MNHIIRWSGLTILFFCLSSLSYAGNYDLRYFLGKGPSKTDELSRNEKTELFDRIRQVLERAEEIRTKLVGGIQTGELDVRYQEGRFWMSRLENDHESIDTGIQQIGLLKEKSTHLVAAVRLFKSLKDLSSNFNAYNNMPAFSAFVGDLAPEIELWADPVFYRFYLLPLVRSKDVERGPSPKEKKPAAPKGKK